MEIVQVVIQGGAVGLAAFAILVIWKLASNHINHNTEILQELKDVIKELIRHLKNGKR